jgi:putative flippase GtrA
MNGLIHQIIKFGSVGLINTAIGLLLIYSAMYFIGLGPGLANAIGYGVGLLVSFRLNRLWTFREKGPSRKFIGPYIMLAGVAYLCNLSIVLVGTSLFHADPYLIQFLGIGAYTLLMFIGSKWFVFRA